VVEPTDLRPRDELGGGGEIKGGGGPRREKHSTTDNALMRAAWWWIDRWRQSAAYRDLTPEQKGMYRDLLDEVWLRDDHIIPDDDRVMGLIVGDPERWKVLRESILCRFHRVESGWTHDTAMEVIGQSKTRADRQKRYRDSKRNASRNGGHNGGRSPSPSPSPSPSLTNGMNERPANPLMVGRRPSIESDGYRLIREINALTPDRDPLDILMDAAGYEAKDGRFRTKVRLETMTDDHLARTVRDLKAHLEEAKRGTTPAK
jgi:uncharacterized protein YdaU (DUF1376 family)